MLVLTEAAAEVVKSVTSTTQIPEQAGLRIASSDAEPAWPSVWKPQQQQAVEPSRS
jgi:hypothetical protein